MVAGVILVLVAVATAAGVLVVATHGSRHKTIVTYRPAAVFSLRAGDCLNSSPNGLSVTILSCATPHQAEVFATFSLTGSSWPGDAAVQQQASSGCANRIAGYLNPQLLNAGLTQQLRLPQPGGLAGGRPHRGVRGQLGQRAAQRLGPQRRLTAPGFSPRKTRRDRLH